MMASQQAAQSDHYMKETIRDMIVVCMQNGNELDDAYAFFDEHVVDEAHMGFVVQVCNILVTPLLTTLKHPFNTPCNILGTPL
jgi:hypothetical protein